MNDMELLDFMVRQYQTQTKMAKALKLGDSTISNWRNRNQLPRAWRMYFQAQFDKSDEARNATLNKALDMASACTNDMFVMMQSSARQAKALDIAIEIMRENKK